MNCSAVIESNFHADILSCCNTVILSQCHAIILSCYETVILLYCLTVMLSYCHAVILSNCYSAILSYYFAVILSRCHAVTPSCCDHQQHADWVKTLDCMSLWWTSRRSQWKTLSSFLSQPYLLISVTNIINLTMYESHRISIMMPIVYASI